MTARRELRTAVLLCLVGSGLALLSVRRDWIAYPASGGLTIHEVRAGVRGTAVAGLAEALSLVGIAGVVALAATRRLGRVVVGALVALAGAGVVAQVVHLVVAGLGHRLATAGCSGLCLVPAERYDASPSWAWPVLTVVGGLLMTTGGCLVAARGRRWAALSSSYEAPVGRPVAPPATDKGTWDALDRGDDPTA